VAVLVNGWPRIAYHPPSVHCVEMGIWRRRHHVSGITSVTGILNHSCLTIVTNHWLWLYG
jgi:hypothetical protein